MDVFAHTLWTNALFHLKYHKQRRMRYIAAFFGVAPDLVGFAPLFIYLFASGRFFHDSFPFTDQSNWTFGFAEQAYNFTHSLVIFAFTTLLVTAIGNLYRRYKMGDKNFWFYWPMLGWALHILIDIPTHPHFYHTPFLFPLSNYQNTHGVSWAHPTFMIINYCALATVYIILTIYQRRQRAQ